MKRFAIPAFIAILTVGIAVAAFQRRTKPTPRTASGPIAQVPTSSRPSQVSPPAARPPAAAPAVDVKTAAELIRVRSNYTSYRAAVASGNAALENALLPSLLRDRKTALAFAEEDMARATDPNDRAVTEKTLAALRR